MTPETMSNKDWVLAWARAASRRQRNLVAEVDEIGIELKADEITPAHAAGLLLHMGLTCIEYDLFEREDEIPVSNQSVEGA